MSSRRGRPAVVRRERASSRLRVSFLAAAFVASLFAGRLVQLQGVDADAYAAMARQEGTRTVTLPAERGSIVDRFGAPLADSVEGTMLTADPTLTARHAREIAAVLSEKLGADYIDMLEVLRTPDTRFVYLARRLRPVQADAVLSELERRGYPGVFAARDPVRSYPSGRVAGNLVGFVGHDGSGLAGIEYAFDERLAGRDGSQTYQVGVDGSRIPLGESFTEQPQTGTGVALTIDRDLQWYAQGRLREAVRLSGGSSGAVVVLDVRSGEVLALADWPAVDPADPSATPEGSLGSRAVQDVYEPGSVQKVVTASALVDAGYVTPRTRITVPPQLERSGETIHDAWDHGTLRLTMNGVIAKSSNIGTVLAAEQMPSRELHRYLRAFGFGAATGVGLPGESPGLLPAPGDWLRLTHDTIAFGQSLSVTAIQMATAVAAVANGGVRVDPTLVKGVVSPDGELTDASEPDRRRVISTRAARVVTEMMEAVTASPEGTAPLAAIPGYRVAGKTGTAQRADPACGCYNGKTVSFVGFAPADQPRFLAYVVVQQPASGSGGTTAAPVFHDVMSYTLQKYGVPPTGSRSPRSPIYW